MDRPTDPEPCRPLMASNRHEAGKPKERGSRPPGAVDGQAYV